MATTFNVDNFKSAIADGGARPNQFMFQLSFPTYVNGAEAVSKSPFLVSVAELPGQTVNPAIVQYRGREVKFAGDRVYSPYTITVLNDTGFVIRNAMEEWMDGMDNYEFKQGFIVPAQYQADIQVYQLDRNGNMLKQYNIINAFPVDMSPIALDFGANDQVSTFQVTFQYQHFTPFF